MKVKYRANLWAGLISIIFGLAVIMLIPAQVGSEYSAGSGMSSKTVPYGMAVLFLVCGAGLVFQSLVLKKDTVREIRIAREGKALFYMALFIVYGILFEYSFILASAFLGCVTLLLTKSKNKGYYGIVILTVVALYFLFTQVLHVRLK